MKSNKLIFGTLLSVLTGISLTSCNNEFVNPVNPELGDTVDSSVLLQAPDIYAWSGKHTLTSSGSRADEQKNDSEIETTPTESFKVNPLHNDEVEVNYSINDIHTDKGVQKFENADLWTKLSIHVRKGTNVKIDVPLPGAYHCASDDFAIFENHLNWAYGEIPGAIDETEGFYYRRMEYSITEANVNVALYLKITEIGMSIWTEGITQNLIDYLYETNDDGLNFEIWNYFDSKVVRAENGAWESTETGEISDEDLDMFQAFLDNSTIIFLNGDRMPSYFINSYGSDPDDKSSIRVRDCRVSPAPQIYQNLFQQYPNYCYHLNGTPWNVVWSFISVDKTSECYEAHTQTPETPVAVVAPKPLPIPVAATE